LFAISNASDDGFGWFRTSTMKLSILTILAAAMVATASVVPCEMNTDDVNELTFYTTPIACLAKCYPRPPHCRPPFRAKKVRPHCWKCCKLIKTSDELDVLEFDEAIDELDA
jgi:hypothetical protein